MTAPPLAEQVAALRQGRAFVDLSSWRKLRVAGADADRWLNDLISADVAGLETGRAVRSLLLSPTGRIRAEFTVARLEDGWLLVQDPEQPSPLVGLLEPYVLSSDVILEDRTGDLSIVALPGADDAGGDAPGYRPSAVGPGHDVVAEGLEEAGRWVAGRVAASPDAVEAWRIERGVPRFGVDLGDDALPHETSLEGAVAYGKGCFLGQEAVARVRNLGHPPFVVVPVRAAGPLAAGDEVLAEGRPAGRVTSAVTLSDGAAAGMVRVRWAARGRPLVTERGTPLEVSAAAGAA